jgi:hypothetical protein
MKTLSTVLFVALMIIAGNNYDINTKNKRVNFSDSNTEIFNNIEMEEETSSQISLKEISLAIDNTNYIEELEMIGDYSNNFLVEIELEIDNTNYLEELESIS